MTHWFLAAGILCFLVGIIFIVWDYFEDEDRLAYAILRDMYLNDEPETPTDKELETREGARD